tara:strand:+ start:170 stop:1324 length:1155 start_codon:yes stop_codon:yes gene_type:complete
MRKMTVVVLLLLISPAIIGTSAAEDDVITTSKISEVTTFDDVLIECFVSITTDDCETSSMDSVVLNWWAWSDETNSNWPDDDAKARAGELFANLTTDNAQMITNEEFSTQQADDNRNEIKEILPVVSLVGELNVYQELGGHRIDMPIEMTPLVNLSDSTIMYIYLSKEYSIDDHNRRLTNLVYEMKPEFGFSNQANNSTQTTWSLSESHLTAAGVDFADSPYGWSVTFALFGSLEGNGTNQLLYLNQVELATQPENVQLNEFMMPIFAIVFGIIVISTILGNMYREEHGMPIITGYWHRDKANCLVVELTTKNRRMEIKSLEVDGPWKLSSRFKSRFIEANKSTKIELKFKQPETAECRIHIRLEVDELGVWTQFLAIASNVNE